MAKTVIRTKNKNKNKNKNKTKNKQTNKKVQISSTSSCFFTGVATKLINELSHPSGLYDVNFVKLSKHFKPGSFELREVNGDLYFR